jgi:hypothetical protein
MSYSRTVNRMASSEGACRRGAWAARAALLGCFCATAGLAAVPTLSAAQIIDKNITARGGLAAWRSVNTLSIKGQLDAGFTRPDPRKVIEDAHRPQKPGGHVKPSAAAADPNVGKPIQLPFAMEMKRPRQTRVEIQFKGDTSVQVYDGAKGWKLRPYLGRHEIEPYTAKELQIAAETPDLDGPLIDYAAKGTKVEAQGVEPVDGHDAYKLKLTLKGGQVQYVWVDAQSFLDVKFASTRRVGGHSQLVATKQADFRAVSGRVVPHSLETLVEGAKHAERILVDNVTVNPVLPDTLFKKPQ